MTIQELINELTNASPDNSQCEVEVAHVEQPTEPESYDTFEVKKVRRTFPTKVKIYIA